MLPLSIFFSEEYRLLTRQQLTRNLGQYFAVPDQFLVDSWQALKPHLPAVSAVEPETPPVIALPPAHPLTAAAANQRFNQYLKLLERPEPSALRINLADLHPRYEAIKRSSIHDGLCHRLHVLALAARENNHQLFLHAPNEATLELTLDILASTLARPDLQNWGDLGICLHTSSKRALPTLAWLEYLGRTLNAGIPIKLITGMPDTKEILSAQYAGYPCYPVLTAPEHWHIGQELCLQFIQSLNNTQLRASLLHHQPLNRLVLPPAQPTDIFQPVRNNAASPPFGQTPTNNSLTQALEQCAAHSLDAGPLINGERLKSPETHERLNPSNAGLTIGQLRSTTEEQVRAAFACAQDIQPQWNRLEVESRADIVQRWAERLQQEQHALVASCVHETGLSIRDALTDLRTAINLCFYYCNQARIKLAPRTLHGHQPEENQLELHGRGIYICLTDHNEPLSTALGQLAALLVSGNSVLLHPDPGSASCLSLAIEYLLEAGLPAGALALLPGDNQVAQWLVEDYRVAGICCFLSPEGTADLNRRLASRQGAPIVPLLSHSCLPGTQILDRRLTTSEIHEVLHSAFSHAGQRRATLGTLYIEASIADEIEQQLAGGMQQLQLGAPVHLDTDIGPLSRRDLMEQTYQHIERLRLRQRVLAQLELNEQHDHGYYVPPTLLRLYTLDELSAPISGPVLHLIRFEREEITRVLMEINRCCPGQACGLYSEDDALIDQVTDELQTSRLLLNTPFTDMSASIHPSGSSGISGTGPLYGGPNYLMAFVRERAITRRR